MEIYFNNTLSFKKEYYIPQNPHQYCFSALHALKPFTGKAYKATGVHCATRTKRGNPPNAFIYAGLSHAQLFNKGSKNILLMSKTKYICFLFITLKKNSHEQS